MISSNFEYFKPGTIQEAINLFHSLRQQGKTPLYYGGGTEIITLSRINLLHTDAVIDVNGIPECNSLMVQNQKFILGSCISLTQAVYQDHFPLLSKTAREIADQTARNKISLGGNICSNIRFKEAILPFLVTEAEVVVATLNGVETLSLKAAFDEEYQLPLGTLLIQLIVDERYLSAPYYANKIRTIGTVGYPVLSINAIKIDGRLKIAASGVSTLPIQSELIDDPLNNGQFSYTERIKTAIEQWTQPMINDIQGSIEYKRFVLERTLHEIFHQLEVE
ncbi:FAD binding domain-containing protein [Bacillus sp. FJAT-49736]|uniref:FAD binding domain-containing protein n=1 Tax=Bacillus sp. FJAT-49736 TaxID=2833582 RepID=UPI001BC9F5F4|nr:FAD binding domain-containing protein [Bacillus sp. FJAT-49736]MBS4173100.1 FAD binding domain-containing protein [Bacillus sp. FJAT-49736]